MKKSFHTLSEIAGTDKVKPHGYHFFYPVFLENIRDENFNMLEIGYGSGESMKMWCEYFPNSNIFCIDINIEKIINNRCKVIKADQSSLKDLEKLNRIIKQAKVIVDDGSHNPKHQFDTFIYLFENLLEDGGIYIIEDIETNYWKSDCYLYGYRIGEFNLLENIIKFQHMINEEFSKVKNTMKISTITYGQNCVIITKRTLEEQKFFEREYRLKFLTK
jgi:hypothetical protein